MSLLSPAAAKAEARLEFEVDELSYRIAGKPLLQSISSRFPAQQLNVIVGPNGAGKTTLLRHLSASLKPQQGEVRFAGRSLSSWHAADLARHRAVLAQRQVLRFAFSVAEVVRLGLYPYQLDFKAEQQLVAAALAAVEASCFSETSYAALSGGEQQRVQIARVLAQVDAANAGSESSQPAALLLDEPLAALDLAWQHRIMRLLKQRAAAGAAIVLVLHELQLALDYADQVDLLSEGKLVASGPANTVLTAEQVSRVWQQPVMLLARPQQQGQQAKQVLAAELQP